MHHIIDHPLIQHKLTQVRDKHTGTKEFRENISEIAGLMAYEITRDMPLKQTETETPMKRCVTSLMERDIVLVPILRAGLGMVAGINSLIPTAKIGHVGIYRDHDTLEPKSYYAKFPYRTKEAMVLVLDPMLATGGSASASLDKLKNEGAVDLKLVCIVGAPEGLERIERDHPDVDVFLAALDEGLNDQGYILPGLGDAGDRLFGTNDFPGQNP